MGSSVVVHLYDLSQGMARQMSMMFLGTHLEGIWHTGVVVYGREWFFGQGIMSDHPSATPYGTPVERIDLGTTERTAEEFMSFLRGISPRFTAATYNLFRHNCNNFSDEVCQFLVGKGIPERITSLPERALSSPMGAMLRPLIDNLERQMSAHGEEFPGLAGGLGDLGRVGDPANPAAAASAPSATSATPSSSEVVPVIFTRHPAPEKIIGKLKLLCKEHDVSLEDGEADAMIKAVDDAVASRKRNSESQISSGVIPDDLAVALQVLSRVLSALPTEKSFPCIDIIRILVLGRAENAHYRKIASNSPAAADSYMALMSKAANAGRGVQLTTLKLLCNMFAHGTSDSVFANPEHVDSALELCAALLENEDAGVRASAASLLRNIAMGLPHRSTDQDIQTVSSATHRLSLESDPAVSALLMRTIAVCIRGDPAARDLVEMLGFDAVEKYVNADIEGDSKGIDEAREAAKILKELMK